MSKPKKVKAKSQDSDSGLPSNRGPFPVSKYIDVHQGKMAKLVSDGYVIDDGTEFVFDEPEIVVLRGIITFDSAVVLAVRKYLKIVIHKEKECLVTFRYSYQCYVTGQGNSEIFRYDNYHEESPHDGHDGPHHVHHFDPPGKQVDGSPFEVTEEKRPFLDAVIREAYECSEKFKKDNPDWSTTRIGDKEGGERK